MAKPELGTKRLCGGCGAKFYDLNKEKIVCPKCGTVFEMARARPEAVARAAAPVKGTAEAEPIEAEAAEFVSLEEADAEAQGKSKLAVPEDVVDDDIEVADDDSMGEDDTFIEEEEEGDADVTDIIGDGIEKEEET